MPTHTSTFFHSSVCLGASQAAKYILASVFMFFAGVACNGDVSPPSKDNLIWTEIVKKGLLTTNEKNVLSRYPGPEIMPVLVTWTMYVVDDALNKDSMWKKRSHRTAHVHDRFHRIVVDLQLAARNIGMWLAMPLPFSYWQFLNWVVFINFTLLSIVLAGFRTWWTVIPYIISLIVFVALREVSNALANPFGRDTVDFPLTRYLEHAFDHGVCLLLAFSHQGADADQYRRVQAQIKNATELEDMEARRRCDAGFLYKDDYRSHVDGFFSWNRTQPLQLLSQNGALDGKCLLTHIEEVLLGMGEGPFFPFFLPVFPFVFPCFPLFPLFLTCFAFFSPFFPFFLRCYPFFSLFSLLSTF